MKKFTKFSRGFTLIELLVVIAIIGILSSIVLASLSTARSKANDSKVQEQLSGLRSAAEIYSATAGGYAPTAAGTVFATTLTGCETLYTSGTVFADPTSGALGIMNGIASTTGVGAVTCVASSTAWAVQVALPSQPATNPYWCVDSTGKSEQQVATVTGTNGTLCK